MGNRALITHNDTNTAFYLGWNGGCDSIETFLAYAKLQGFAERFNGGDPQTDPENGFNIDAWLRFGEIMRNYLGSSFHAYQVQPGFDPRTVDLDHGDNGTYVIDGWEIVERLNFDGDEQNEHDFAELLRDIDRAQPARTRLGDAFIELVASDRDLFEQVAASVADYTPTGGALEYARSEGASALALAALAGSSSDDIRRNVAGNRNTPAGTLEILSSDPDRFVRWAVAGNLNTPAETLQALEAGDPSEWVRKDATEALAKRAALVA